MTLIWARGQLYFYILHLSFRVLTAQFIIIMNRYEEIVVICPMFYLLNYLTDLNQIFYSYKSIVFPDRYRAYIGLFKCPRKWLIILKLMKLA